MQELKIMEELKNMCRQVSWKNQMLTYFANCIVFLISMGTNFLKLTTLLVTVCHDYERTNILRPEMTNSIRSLLVYLEHLLKVKLRPSSDIFFPIVIYEYAMVA